MARRRGRLERQFRLRERVEVVENAGELGGGMLQEEDATLRAARLPILAVRVSDRAARPLVNADGAEPDPHFGPAGGVGRGTSSLFRRGTIRPSAVCT